LSFTAAHGVGLLVVVALIAYGVLGGADFGGGVWDLLASGARKSQQRALIARVMGPVWEANHVWLIFAVVLVFSSFPSAFAVLSVALFVPLHLALAGIVLRGAAFVYRAYGPSSQSRQWGALFGAASAVTPLLLGASMAAVSSGKIQAQAGLTVAGADAWCSPLGALFALLALAVCAYQAAVFLCSECDGALQDDFRLRALGAGTAVVILSVLTPVVLRGSAPRLGSELLSARALSAVLLGLSASMTTGLSLYLRRFAVARVASTLQIGFLLGGWSLAQFPYVIYPGFTLDNSAAPRATLHFILYSTPVGMALLIPSLLLLFRVFRRSARGD
jgi:cytochrome d ubiquinol oxidase subunit II